MNYALSKKILKNLRYHWWHGLSYSSNELDPNPSLWSLIDYYESKPEQLKKAHRLLIDMRESSWLVRGFCWLFNINHYREHYYGLSAYFSHRIFTYYQLDNPAIVGEKPVDGVKDLPVTGPRWQGYYLSQALDTLDPTNLGYNSYDYYKCCLQLFTDWGKELTKLNEKSPFIEPEGQRWISGIPKTAIDLGYEKISLRTETIMRQQQLLELAELEKVAAVEQCRLEKSAGLPPCGVARVYPKGTYDINQAISYEQLRPYLNNEQNDTASLCFDVNSGVPSSLIDSLANLGLETCYLSDGKIDAEQFKKVVRKLRLRTHPDKQQNNDASAYIKIQKAFDRLERFFIRNRRPELSKLEQHYAAYRETVRVQKFQCYKDSQHTLPELSKTLRRLRQTQRDKVADADSADDLHSSSTNTLGQINI